MRQGGFILLSRNTRRARNGSGLERRLLRSPRETEDFVDGQGPDQSSACGPGLGSNLSSKRHSNRQMSGEIKTHEDAGAFAQSWLARGTTDARPVSGPAPDPRGR